MLDSGKTGRGKAGLAIEVAVGTALNLTVGF